MGANIIMKNERNRQMNDILMQDSINYQTQTSGWWVKIKNNLMADTISDQKYIWKYSNARWFTRSW